MVVYCNHVSQYTLTYLESYLSFGLPVWQPGVGKILVYIAYHLNAVIKVGDHSPNNYAIQRSQYSSLTLKISQTARLFMQLSIKIKEISHSFMSAGENICLTIIARHVWNCLFFRSESSSLNYWWVLLQPRYSINIVAVHNWTVFLLLLLSLLYYDSIGVIKTKNAPYMALLVLASLCMFAACVR